MGKRENPRTFHEQCDRPKGSIAALGLIQLPFLALGHRGRYATQHMTTFNANSVVIDASDDGFILVGFAEEQDGEYQDALHFQRAYEFDDQDVSLGMDQIYVERGIQAGGGYGGIVSVDLYSDRIRVVTSGRTARSLGDTEFTIFFTLTEEEMRRLQNGLRTVFDGFPLLTEHVA